MTIQSCSTKNAKKYGFKNWNAHDKIDYFGKVYEILNLKGHKISEWAQKIGSLHFLNLNFGYFLCDKLWTVISFKRWERGLSVSYHLPVLLWRTTRSKIDETTRSKNDGTTRSKIVMKQSYKFSKATFGSWLWEKLFFWNQKNTQVFH